MNLSDALQFTPIEAHEFGGHASLSREGKSGYHFVLEQYGQGVSLFPIDASKVRLTLFALAARRVDSEAAPQRPRPIVCRLVRWLHSCSRCDTPPPGRVPVLGC